MGTLEPIAELFERGQFLVVVGRKLWRFGWNF